jgi:hypothetical protein
MGALTPVRSGSSAYMRFRALSHELRHFHEQVSPIHACGLPDHSVSNHPAHPVVAFPRYPSARQVPAVRGPGFAFGMQAHQPRQTESSSSSYGLVFRLLLLPTPPHGDAVAFGYGPESVCPEGTFTSLTIALSGAHTIVL